MSIPCRARDDMAELEKKPTLQLDGGLSYKGEIRAQVPHGFGKLKWPSGDVYVGYFVNGKRHGRGKRTNADGSFFEGDYEEDQPSGQGY